MTLQEGQIYEGKVAALGGDGPLQRWIVVSPLGKTHCHSINDPTDLHCMPVAVAESAIEQGRLTLVATEPEHPVLRLQRAKEARGIVDAHMGLQGDNLARMLELLRAAVAAGEDYVPYAAGEVFAQVSEHRHEIEAVEAVRAQVRDALDHYRSEARVPG